MNSLEASIRENKTKGQLNAIRNNGSVPAIIYGGKDENQKISISKKLLTACQLRDSSLYTDICSAAVHPSTEPNNP